MCMHRFCTYIATCITTSYYTQDDNKEKEQRIIKLEAYFNYHTNELSKLEAARKQTIANNQALEESIRDISKSKTFIEEEYQKVKELYEQTKVVKHYNPHMYVHTYTHMVIIISFCI